MSFGNKGDRPPGRALAARFLRPFLDRRDREDVLASLDELYHHRVRSRGSLRAGSWYWWEMTKYVWALLIHRADFREPRTDVAAAARPGGWQWVESVAADLRYAIRSFLRSPVVTLAIMLTVGLAVGANTAVFSFADALILRPLPVREPDRLLSLLHVSTEGSRSYSSFSYPDYVELRDQARSLAGLAAYSGVDVNLGDRDQGESVEALLVSGNYFSVLGVEPFLGRAFLPEEDLTEGTHPVLVVSAALWERSFGADPNVIGQSILLNGRPFTVVGVAPDRTPTVDLGASPQLWIPFMMHEVALPSFRAFGTPLFYNRGTHWLDLLGRLTATADRSGALQEFRTLARRQAAAYPETNGAWGITAVPVGEARSGPPGSSPLVRLTGLVGAVVAMVLLIACANVANLLLARSAGRREEMWVRIAIGAERTRIVRQMLTEALLLAVCGTVLGVAIARGSMELITAAGVTDSLPGLDVRLDGRVLGFAASVAVLTGLVFGLFPALRASSVPPGRRGRRLETGRAPVMERRFLRQALIVVQVAFSLVLVVGAGLALQTVWNLRSVPLGFGIADVRVVAVDLSDSTFFDERGRAVQDELLRRVRALPGVESASFGFITPFGRSRMANDVLWEGNTPLELNRTNVDMNVVGVGYFESLGIRVLRGRTFTDRDLPGATDVVVVNEAMADRLWPEQDPIGKRIWSWNPNGADRPLDVVGVVSNGRYYRSWRRGDRPFAFLPLAQSYMSRMSLHIRGSDDGRPDESELHRMVTGLDAAIPRPSVRMVSEVLNESIALERASARVLTLFGALALLIAAIGIYGAVSFAVSERTKEIGVRMALGAASADVYRVVLIRSVVPVLIGTSLGWLATLVTSRFMSSLLFGVDAQDPTTFAAVGALLVAVGLLASVIPAHRATRVDPLTSLRPE